MRRTILWLAVALAGACRGGGGDTTTEPGVLATRVAPTGGSAEGAVGTSVEIPPSVIVTDVNDGPVGGVVVRFAVVSGRGSITGAVQTTDANGIATVGSWTLGPEAGENKLTAAVTGLAGSPVTFTAHASILFTSADAAARFTCALTSTGAPYCWGKNGDGALGDNTTTDRLSPVPVQGGRFFTALTGFYHMCGLTNSGAAFCWGDNLYGGLGDNTTTNQSAPTAVQGGLTFTSLSTGQYYTCGLTGTGAAYCWGRNDSGQLGDGTTTDRHAPVAVQGGHIFTSLAAGGNSHVCGVTSTGAAYCWGRNDVGQLGDGSKTNRSIPAAVQSSVVFAGLVGGYDHVCGRTAAGAAYCWGYNGQGQLGDGTTTSHSLPAPVLGGVAFTSMTAAVRHTCGLTGAGAAYCWGDNEYGELGDGTVTPRLTPVAVSGGLIFSSLTSVLYHGCARTIAGAMYCWGRNEFGQLGDGSVVNRSTPVAVVRP